MVNCLNPDAWPGHENADDAISCRRCGFLVQGACIGIYKIVAFIDAGSYGHVYQVREPAPLSRILALKVLRIDKLRDQALAQFFDEARRIANLRHPYILPIYSFGQLDDRRPYFAVDLALRTINDLFRTANGSQRPALAEELVEYLHQAAEALDYVHKQGVIHQDIKPGNLLIGQDGKIRLSDFGTTLDLGQLTHLSIDKVMGTAAYLSPEQWRGKPRRDSDQYALAITCYQLLTLHLPFEPSDYPGPEQMMNAHLTKQPPTPQQWNPRIPREVAAVLLRAMSKAHQQRYPTILEFAENYTNAVKLALQRYLCQQCGHQNRSSARRCSGCGTQSGTRLCPYCEAPVRFGQRCCAVCGRLTIISNMEQQHFFSGLAIRQGRYFIKRLLKISQGSKVVVAVASDTHANDQQVVLKRWECTDFPLPRRAKDFIYYEHETEPLARLSHPMIPRVLDRFAEGKYYYMVLTYIDGESLEEGLQKLLSPLPEREVIHHMNTLLNVLIALEQQQPPLRHYDISPANIIIEKTRGRACLTGFRISPPTTQKLPTSPYLPVKDGPPPFYNQRTCIYMLAASMHHALTNYTPPPYPADHPPPPVRLLNSAISLELEMVLNRALTEDAKDRYQSYQAMQGDIKDLLSQIRTI